MFWINHTAQGAPLTIPQIHTPRRQPRDFSGAHSLSPAAFTHFCTPTFLVIVSRGQMGHPPPNSVQGFGGVMSCYLHSWRLGFRVQGIVITADLLLLPAPTLVWLVSAALGVLLRSRIRLPEERGKTQLAGFQTPET